MSADTHQTALPDVLHDSRQAERDRVLAQFNGAVYGKSHHEPEWAADAGCCRSCGTDVSEVVESDQATVTRVFGDEHGRIPCCPECSSCESVAAAVMSMPKQREQARYRSREVFYRREIDE